MGVKRTQIVKFIRQGEKGDTGSRGPALRGPQDWSKCAAGYAFQSGAEGEPYKDVVLYGNNYYSCVKSHAKTTGNYPGSSTAVANGYWQLSDKMEMVATRILLSAYALIENLGVGAIEMKDADGNIVFQAKDGNVTCKTGTFNNIKVQSGDIAGFSVKGNGLTNADHDNDAYVMCRNNTVGTLASIGSNVLTAASGVRAVARFENHDASDSFGVGCNYVMMLSAQGAMDCRALWMNGGSVSGFAMRNTLIGAVVTAKTLERSDYNVLALNTSDCTLTLPVMQLHDDGHVIRIKRLGSGKLYLKLNYCYTYNGTSSRYSRPVLVYNQGEKLTGTNTVEVSSIMDSMELVWVRDIAYTINNTVYYGAWIQYKLPRDW